MAQRRCLCAGLHGGSLVWLCIEQDFLLFYSVWRFPLLSFVVQVGMNQMLQALTYHVARG